MSHLGRRACSLAVVLAVLAAPLLGSSGAIHCRECAPGCPMHSKRLGCHRAVRHQCHGASAPGLRNACAHRSGIGVAPAPLWATLRPPAAERPAPRVRPLVLVAYDPSARPDPEPATHPPRASVV